MSDEFLLENAPIIEAVIDLHVAGVEERGLDTLEAFHARITSEYPERQDRVEGEFEFFAGESVNARASHRKVGYIYRRGEGDFAIQARTTGMTVSRFSPYSKWDDLRDEARRWWDVYREVVGADALARIGLRYINQFELGLGEWRDVFAIRPEIPSGALGEVSNMFMRVEAPQPDLGGNAVITQTRIPDGAPDRASFILDIDLMVLSDLPDVGDGLWERLDSLRVRKNELFAASFTKPPEEVFDHAASA